MANKNHSLDQQIVTAAFHEFLTYGYEKASLRKIAASAGVTVGAIYTRYSTKDSLFCSLVQPLVDRIEQSYHIVRMEYESRQPFSPQKLSESLRRESEVILHLLFDDYDRAVLLLCRSAGSSLSSLPDLIVQNKIKGTASFLQQAGVDPIDPGVLKLLLTAQFHMYFQVINEGYDLERARKTMNAVMCYHAGGWLTLLQEFNRSHHQEEK